jgi:hypothetical protein
MLEPNEVDAFSPHAQVLATLENLDAVITPAAGAILFNRAYGVTGLRRNLHAAAAASGLGLASLDYAKRAYTTDEPERSGGAIERFTDIYHFARQHMADTKARLASRPETPDHFGTFAASVALQRLSASFQAAHLLYGLGLNVEGDAVSRLILEQIAWAVAAAQLDSRDEVRKVKAESSITQLKALLPDTGRLYGELSKIAHAGYLQHRDSFLLGDEEQGAVLLAWSRLAPSARLLGVLADAWVVGCEVTQADQLETFTAIRSRIDRSADPDRTFPAVMAKEVHELDLLERSEHAI